MVRSMIYASNMPLLFWGDAADYGTHILNWSSIKSNPGVVLPMEFLTEKVPIPKGIKGPGSTCIVHSDAKNRSVNVVRPPSSLGVIQRRRDMRSPSQETRWLNLLIMSVILWKYPMGTMKS